VTYVPYVPLSLRRSASSTMAATVATIATPGPLGIPRRSKVASVAKGNVENRVQLARAQIAVGPIPLSYKPIDDPFGSPGSSAPSATLATTATVPTDNGPSAATVATVAGGPGGCDFTDRLEERAAHLEYDAGVPRAWVEPFARLLCSGPPSDFAPARWRRVVDGGLRFADEWACKAYQLGWTAEDVFGLHPFAPAARNDCKGIAWLLGRGRVVAIDAAGADIVTEGGSKQRFYRNSKTAR
jgi:hypothetical protein